MKRILLVLVLGVMAVLGAVIVSAQDGGKWIAPPEVEGETVYIPFPVQIKVDGDLSDWSGVQPITVARGPKLSKDPMDNGSFTFGVAADQDNFYIYMTMPDKKIISGQHNADYWNEDSMEFYLNLSGDLTATKYTKGVFQLNIKPLDIGKTDPKALTITGSSSSGVPVSGIVFKTPDGWGFEAAVALQQYGITPSHGLAIGFQAQANGATTKDRDVKLIWSKADTNDNSWQNPSLFGTGIFFEVGRTDVPQPVVAAAPTPVPTPVPEVTTPTNPVIRTNEIGYFRKGPKIAVRVAKEGEAPGVWSLVDTKTNISVLKGAVSATQWDEASGDYVQIADFSKWSLAGKYILEIGDEKSAPFAIANDIYGKLSVDAIRYFYLSRSGIELTKDLAGEWARPAGHLSDAKITCFKGVDADGKTWPGCDYEIDGSGGWYDAGDYGKYVVNGGISLWTLLDLYEHFPKAFPDGSLSIPESSNGVPDILDEARWEMEWMLKMQLPDSDPLAGMAFHKLHDQAWSGVPAPLPTQYDNDNANADPVNGRYVYEPTTAATLNLAATAAQCARVWKDIDADFSAKCLTAAQKAWNAALKNPDLLAGNTPGAGGGNYTDANVSDEFMWAASELYVTTQDQTYLDKVKEYTAPIPSVATGAAASMDWGTTAALGMITLATVGADADYQKQIIAAADGYVADLKAAGYVLPMGIKGYVWGSDSVVLNNAIILALAYDFTGNQAYLDGVVAATDYLLGRNALSTSFITGYGQIFPQHPHHRFWANQGDFPPPPPGVVVGGPNADPSDPDSLANAILDSGPSKRYIDMLGAYSTNEVAINWNAPLVWVVTYLDQHYNKK